MTSRDVHTHFLTHHKNCVWTISAGHCSYHYIISVHCFISRIHYFCSLFQFLIHYYSLLFQFIIYHFSSPFKFMNSLFQFTVSVHNLPFQFTVYIHEFTISVHCFSLWNQYFCSLFQFLSFHYFSSQF